MGKKNAKNQTLKKLSGKEGFDVYYAEIFGTRWENLKCALSLENKGIKLKSFHFCSLIWL